MDFLLNMQPHFGKKDAVGSFFSHFFGSFNVHPLIIKVTGPLTTRKKLIP